jgi:hypothetical protein
MNYFDAIFPPSLTRITRSFERTRSRLAAFAARTTERGSALREQADALHMEANSTFAEADRAARLALRFNDLLN